MQVDDDAIQAIQSELKRTYKGRIIRKRAHDAVDVWKQAATTPFEKTECKTCGLVLKSNFFVHGCLNCGSTDTENL